MSEHDKAYAEIQRRLAAYDKMLEALEFYADPEAWKPLENGIGVGDGPAIDYGETARAALSAARIKG